MNKILVRLPSGPEKVLASFGFFHALKEKFPASTIQVIVDEVDERFFHFLDIDVEHFLIPEDKLGIMGAHHYAVNLSDVFNIDLYIDLASTVHSALLGRSFRPKESVGFKTFVSQFLYSKIFVPVEDMPLDRKYLFLLEQYLETSLVETKAFAEIPEYIDGVENEDNEEEAPDYLVIYWDQVNQDEIYQEIWKEFLDSFDGQNFHIWINEEDKQFFTEFYNVLDQRNKFIFHFISSKDELLKDLRNSKGLISNAFWPTLAASYYAVQGFWLGKEIHYWSPDLYKVSPGFINMVLPNKYHVEWGEDKFDAKDVGGVIDYLYTLLSL